MAWIDRDSGRKVHITTSGHTGGECIARVKTYRDVLREYRTNPEPKSLGSNGQPCDRKAQGLLSRRPVIVAHITYIGKESNKLDDREAGLVHDLGEVITEYADPRRDALRILALPVLQTVPPGDIARETNIAQRTLRDIMAGRAYPHPEHKTRLMAFALRRARNALRQMGITRPHYDLAACAAYLEERKSRSIRVCLTCQRPLTHPRAHYCSSACRQRDYRKRSHLQEAANLS